MMRTQIQLVGNLGRDPELRDAGETKVCSLAVAVNRRVKGEDLTDWFNVDAWGKLGERCAEYLSKGAQVVVAGSFAPRGYEKDGEKRVSFDVQAHEVHFPRRSTEQRSTEEDETIAATQHAKDGGDRADDSIPF